MTDEPFLGPQDIADLTGIGYHSVLREIKAGRLAAYKLRGKIRVRPADYEAWLGANLIQPVAPAKPRAPKRSSGPAEAGSLASLRAMERGAA